MAPDVQRRGESIDETDVASIVASDAGYRYRLAEGERPSVAVVSAVTEHLHGVGEGIELGQRLYERIDPDALDSLFRDDGGVVSFGFNGCHVTVIGDDEVLVCQPTGDA